MADPTVTRAHEWLAKGVGNWKVKGLYYIGPGQDPLDATLDLLVEEEGQVSCCLWAMSEQDVRLILSHPLAVFLRG